MFPYSVLLAISYSTTKYLLLLPGNNVMADIFICTLKILIGVKLNTWHTYIKKNKFLNASIQQIRQKKQVNNKSINIYHHKIMK